MILVVCVCLTTSVLVWRKYIRHKRLMSSLDNQTTHQDSQDTMVTWVYNLNCTWGNKGGGKIGIFEACGLKKPFFFLLLKITQIWGNSFKNYSNHSKILARWKEKDFLLEYTPLQDTQQVLSISLKCNCQEVETFVDPLLTRSSALQRTFGDKHGGGMRSI